MSDQGGSWLKCKNRSRTASRMLGWLPSIAESGCHRKVAVWGGHGRSCGACTSMKAEEMRYAALLDRTN